MPSEQSSSAIEHVTPGLAIFPTDSEPHSPVSRDGGILFAFVVHTNGTGSYGRVDSYDRTGISSTPVTSKEAIRHIIEKKLELWSTDPYSEECWAYHNNDDVSPTEDNTVLYLEETFEGEFTQREFFGGYTLQQFVGGGRSVEAGTDRSGGDSA